MRTRTGWLAAVGACAVLAVAGCSSNDLIADPTTATGTPAMSSMSTSSVTSAPSSSVQPSTSRSATSPSPPSSTSGAAATPSLPAGLTPAQVADAKEAVAAYVGYYGLVDRAYADPGKDWSKEAAKLAADPVKSSLLRNLAGTAKLGQYRNGTIEVEPRVAKVEPALVTITSCVDATAMGFFDKNGMSIKAPDAPGSYFRHVSEVQVAQYVGGDWLVTFITDDYNKTC